MTNPCLYHNRGRVGPLSHRRLLYIIITIFIFIFFIIVVITITITTSGIKSP